MFFMPVYFHAPCHENEEQTCVWTHGWWSPVGCSRGIHGQGRRRKGAQVLSTRQVESGAMPSVGKDMGLQGVT